MNPSSEDEGLDPSEHEELEFINRSHINWYLFTNMNRAAIIYLLNNNEKKEMQSERISYKLGISHRTVLYHLDILLECGFLEIRKFRNHGKVKTRSVWGLNLDNCEMIDVALEKIADMYGAEKLDAMITREQRKR